MNARIFEMLPDCTGALDAAALVPERVHGMSESEIGDMQLGGNARVRDCFSISGIDSDHLVLRGGPARLDNVGRDMRSGRMIIEGDCGNFAGLGMRGGAIAISGNAGEFSGCEMRGGTLEIAGNTGNFAGASQPGSMQGMRGGYLVVHGNAGDRVGDRMRRGLILVGGNGGAFCGSRMLAGTIVVKGTIGPMPGLGLKRGTLILDDPPSQMPATFQDCGSHRLLVLRLMDKELRRLGGPFERFSPLAIEVRRYCGDLGIGGAGEILVPVAGQGL